MIKALPISYTTEFDRSPNRVGRRIIWKFKLPDGSTHATYSSKTGMRLANEMMKAGLL